MKQYWLRLGLLLGLTTLVGSHAIKVRSAEKCSTPQWSLELASIELEEVGMAVTGSHDSSDTAEEEDSGAAWAEEAAAWPEEATFADEVPTRGLYGDGLDLELEILRESGERVRLRTALQ